LEIGQILSNLPSPIKFFLLSLILVIAATILKLDVNSLFQPNSSDLVPVELIIRTKDGKPIEGVEIQFISKGAPASKLTNTDGYVSLKIPSRSDIDIVLRKEGFKPIKKTINLTTDPDRTKTIEIEPLNLQPVPSSSPHSEKSSLSILNSKQSNLKCQQTLENEQFIFELKTCKKSNSNLIINFIIKNIGRKRDFFLKSNGTRIFDEAGNENHARTVFLGAQYWDNYSRTTLPSNTSIKAGIKFEEVIIEGGKISLLEIETSMFKIEFRNIPFSQ
jgi:hypothetical protein